MYLSMYLSIDRSIHLSIYLDCDDSTSNLSIYLWPVVILNSLDRSLIGSLEVE